MSEAAPVPFPDPVSLVIRRRILPGREAEYEALVSQVSSVLAAQPGFMGNWVVRPAPGEREYLLGVRFASAQAAQTWEQSPERAAWLAEVDGVVEHHVSFERQPGLELWLSAPASEPVPQPPRWKTAILILCVLFPVSQAVSHLLSPHLAGWPPLPRSLLQSAVVVTLMTYVFMPWATRLADPWLKR